MTLLKNKNRSKLKIRNPDRSWTLFMFVGAVPTNHYKDVFFSENNNNDHN